MALGAVLERLASTIAVRGRGVNTSGFSSGKMVVYD
jgi:hypothetical protein